MVMCSRMDNIISMNIWVSSYLVYSVDISLQSEFIQKLNRHFKVVSSILGVVFLMSKLRILKSKEVFGYENRQS